MDALFTTFLSSGSGTIDKNFATDFINREKELGEWKFHKHLSQNQKHKAKFKQHINKRRNRRSSATDYLMHVKDLSFEVDKFPAVNITITQTVELNKSNKGISFVSYVNHQMFHKLIQKRIALLCYVQPECCLIFCSKISEDHIDNKLHHCCNGEMLLVSTISLCTCENFTLQSEMTCNQHNLSFTDTHKTNWSCSWAINESNTKSQHDKVICKPLCELNIPDLNMNLSSDSFDIEFINNDGNNADVYCELNTDCLHNFEYFYNSDSDHDDNDESESSVYETSDDDEQSDEDNDVCFDDDVIHVDVIATPLKMNYHTVISKYHKNCCLKATVVKENDCKRSVRFAGETEHSIIAWKYAYKQARKSDWVKVANDRAHFQRKVQHISKVLNPVLLKKCEIISTLTRKSESE